MASMMAEVQHVPKDIIDHALDVGVISAGVMGGMAAGEAAAAAFTTLPSLPLGPVTFGIGDLATVAVGVAAMALAGKAGKGVAGYIKKAAGGAIGGWAVNKIAQAVTGKTVFNNLFPSLGGGTTALARSRQLYGGNVFPSQAYVGNGVNVSIV